MTTAQTIFSVIYSSLYYLVFPLLILLNWVHIALGVIAAPLLHLGHYILHACLWPLRILARFEVCLDGVTGLPIGRTNLFRPCIYSLALPPLSALSRA